MALIDDKAIFKGQDNSSVVGIEALRDFIMDFLTLLHLTWKFPRKRYLFLGIMHIQWKPGRVQ